MPLRCGSRPTGKDGQRAGIRMPKMFFMVVRQSFRSGDSLRMPVNRVTPTVPKHVVLCGKNDDAL